MPKAVHAIISGRVQGVGFRAWTAGSARKLGLDGWVRNRTDGTVEAVFSGDEEAVEEVLEDCWNGPLPARVEEVEVKPAKPPPEPGFIQRSTV